MGHFLVSLPFLDGQFVKLNKHSTWLHGQAKWAQNTLEPSPSAFWLDSRCGQARTARISRIGLSGLGVSFRKSGFKTLFVGLSALEHIFWINKSGFLGVGGWCSDGIDASSLRSQSDFEISPWISAQRSGIDSVASSASVN